jgi:hypothetical protein
MNHANSLERLAGSAQRSGWTIAVLCALALPFAFPAPFAVACSAFGLLAGIEEVRRGRRLLRSPHPGADLRRIGVLHALFTSSLLLYFAQKSILLLLGGTDAEMLGVDAETAALLRTEAPEIIELTRSLGLVTTLAAGVVAVAWQTWWSIRYFRAAARIGVQRYVPPIVLQFSAEDRAALERLAAMHNMSVEDLIRDALRQATEPPTPSSPGSG